MPVSMNCPHCGDRHFGQRLREAQEKVDACAQPVVIKETMAKPEEPKVKPVAKTPKKPTNQPTTQLPERFA